MSSRRYWRPVLLTLGLAAWAVSCTKLDDLTAPSCAFVLTSTSAAFDSRGGTGTVAVQAPGSCTWTVATNDAWVALTTAASGSGDATIGYSVAANASAATRRATLDVSGQSFTVSQSGAPVPVCTYAAAPSTAVFLPGGGSGTITVTADAGCPWAATTQANWITITAGKTGAGNGVVSYAVERNKSKNVRNGTITVAGRTATISQGGELR